MVETSALSDLEGLLTRLYSSDCSNEERYELNKLLDAFSSRSDVWKYCIYFLQNSSNVYILMYSLHVIENTVIYRWRIYDETCKLELRKFLMEYLIHMYRNLTHFVQNKLIHVIVLIGREDWPHHYPDFITSIIHLTKQSDTMLLGLSLLTTASEELATPKTALILSSRRLELLTLMSQQAPIIITTLIEILDAAFKPHPQIGKDTPLYFEQVSLQIQPEVCVQTLNCLSHVFSWIPLSTLMTPSILETIFHYACLGCYSNNDPSEYSGTLGSLAMDCVNELLIKNCVPREFDVFLMKFFDQSFALLRMLTGTNESTQKKKKDFSHLDDRYLSKCGDLFYWFVSSHLKRVEFNPQFPVLEFLALFYRYTFNQPEIDSFCVCLDTWGIFLDHLIMMAEDNGADLSPHSSKHNDRYKDILIGMCGSVLEKIQMHYNLDELREIDDDTINDDETEWQSFLRKSLEFVGKVAELFPTETFQMIVPLLERYSQVYLSLSQLITIRGKDRVLVLSEEQCRSLHATLKDLTSVLQALGRLAEHFSSDRSFTERLPEAQQLMNRFVMIAQFSTDNLLFNIETPVPLVLEHDFLEIHAQALGTLQAYQHWLSKFYLATLRGEQPHDIFHYLLTAFINAAVPVITHNVPEKIALAACRLLVSLSFTIRPHFLSQLPLIQDLLVQASHAQFQHLPFKVNTMLHEALVGMLILPWPNVSDSQQKWDARYQELCKVITGMTANFCQFLSTPNFTQNSHVQQQAKSEIKQTLSLFQEIIVSVSYERKRSKSILYESIRTHVENIIPLFHIYLGDPDVLEVLMNFFYTLFHGLLSQVGPPLTERITQTFMTLLTKELLEESMLQENSTGVKVIEKLLLQNYSVNNKAFLPNIVNFAMKQIYPVVITRDLPEVKFALYELLFQLLLNNWRYFFPLNVTSTKEKKSDQSINEESLCHNEEFTAIMESFAQSFLQSDINIFRHNLESFKVLNKKHKLFSKQLFCSTMSDHFLNLLLQVLTHQSHNLLQEEIAEIVYEMAEVNLVNFHTNFLSKFLGNVDGILPHQQMNLVDKYKIVQDQPSFTHNLLQFASDLHYYLTINAVQSPSHQSLQ